MRILYVAMAHDYGQPELGPSFEEVTFRSALEGMGHELHPYDFKAREHELGRDAMNAELAARAAELQPALAFFSLYEEETAPGTIEAAGRHTTPTNWFADDPGRFEGFSRHYARALDWVVTTAHDAV